MAADVVCRGDAGQEGDVAALTVLSWNVDSRGNGLERRIYGLDRFRADVVLLQEVSRGAAARLNEAPGFAWAEVAVLHSEPDRGPSARIGPAILGSHRATLCGAGQVPPERFVEAGLQAGLSEAEVHRIGWRHKTIYADVEIDGARLRLCSFHARPGSGGGPGRPALGYVKQLFHRVCAGWVAEHDGSMAFGIDANSPEIDHPDPDEWKPFMAGEATLIGPRPRHHLTDALYRWLDDHPEERDRLRAVRPTGPLAISYYTPRTSHPRRYDHLFVTDDISVDAIEYRPPREVESDHGAVVAQLSLDSSARG